MPSGSPLAAHNTSGNTNSMALPVQSPPVQSPLVLDETSSALVLVSNGDSTYVCEPFNVLQLLTLLQRNNGWLPRYPNDFESKHC